jgi:uncharacterized protein YqeY
MVGFYFGFNDVAAKNTCHNKVRKISKEEIMSLKEQITSDMKDAMRSKEAERLGTIRLLLAAMKQKEVDERVELTDAHIVAIIEKMVKQRKDSITQFAAAKRDDLVLQETKELELLQTYMPTQLSDDEVMAAVQKAVKMSGATGPQDMGKVIGLLKAELAGKADMGKVSGLVKNALQK